MNFGATRHRAFAAVAGAAALCRCGAARPFGVINFRASCPKVLRCGAPAPVRVLQAAPFSVDAASVQTHVLNAIAERDLPGAWQALEGLRAADHAVVLSELIGAAAREALVHQGDDRDGDIRAPAALDATAAARAASALDVMRVALAAARRGGALVDAQTLGLAARAVCLEDVALAVSTLVEFGMTELGVGVEPGAVDGIVERLVDAKRLHEAIQFVLALRNDGVRASLDAYHQLMVAVDSHQRARKRRRRSRLRGSDEAPPKAAGLLDQDLVDALNNAVESDLAEMSAAAAESIDEGDDPALPGMGGLPLAGGRGGGSGGASPAGFGAASDSTLSALLQVDVSDDGVGITVLDVAGADVDAMLQGLHSGDIDGLFGPLLDDDDDDNSSSDDER